MPSYQPKTDSQEFQIASPVQPSLAPIQHGSGAIDVTIRTWTSEADHTSTRVSWSTDLGLIYMIADLVTASRGRPAEEFPASLVARFESASQALVAAKRIHTSVAAWAAGRSNAGGVALVIHGPVNASSVAGTGLDRGSLVRSVLAQAQAGQVLVQEDAYKQLQAIPGVQFRRIGPVKRESGSNTFELIWNASPDSKPPVLSEISLGVAPQTTARADAAADAPPRSQDSAATRWVARSEIASRPEHSAANESQPAHPGQNQSLVERPPLVTPKRYVMGVVALLVVFGLALAIFELRAPKLVDHPQANQSSPPTVEPTNPQVTPSPQQPPQPSVPDAGVSASEPKTAQPAAEPQRPSKKKRDTEQTNQKPSQVDGFFASDIPNLLRKAEHDAGEGNYQDARREYQVILRLDPNNATARQGLHRLDLSQ